MFRRAASVALLVALAIPAQARGLRFHCLVTGSSDLDACCCTGSTTEACGDASLERSCGL